MCGVVNFGGIGVFLLEIGVLLQTSSVFKLSYVITFLASAAVWSAPIDCPGVQVPGSVHALSLRPGARPHPLP